MQDGLLFKLYKEGNAFYWMGAKEIYSRQRGVPVAIPMGGGILYGMEATSAAMGIRFTPLLLNIDTGEEY